LSESVALRRRHACYWRLLALCIGLMISFALPSGWNRLSAVGYNLLPLVMIRGMGRPLGAIPFGAWARRFYCLLGVGALISSLGWYLTPSSARGTGVAMLVLWTLFIGWSTVRLVRGLGFEQRITGRVLMGACAGYLLIGLTGGLLFSALETIHSGSFSSVHGPAIRVPITDQFDDAANVLVWQFNFVRLNYFAFVSLTTVGFGDITPLTSQAQMASVAISVIGTFYLAVVMGLLISRATVQVEQDAESPATRAGHRPDE
jgi:voltage-gated potassium channel